MFRNYKILFALLSGFACLSLRSYAQQGFVLKGILFKKGTAERITQAFVTNLRTKTIMITDELGDFGISATKGDTLLFTKKEYADQKLLVVDENDVAIYMQPALIKGQGTVLNEVTVKEQSKQQELNEVMKEYRNKGIYNDGASLPLLEFINSPVSGLYQLFAKGPKDARRFKKDAKMELENNAVDKRYSTELVMQTTGIITKEDARKFMDLYTPSYEDIKAWSDYQVIIYIKKSYAYYKKHKNAGKLQKLY